MAKAPRGRGVDLVPPLRKTGKDMEECEEGAFGFKGCFEVSLGGLPVVQVASLCRSLRMWGCP